MKVMSHTQRPGIALILHVILLTEYNELQHWHYRVFLIYNLQTRKQVKFTVHDPIFSLPFRPQKPSILYANLSLKVDSIKKEGNKNFLEKFYGKRPIFYTKEC
jgi:hypothetical protein